MNRTRDAEEPLLADPAVVDSFKAKLVYQLRKREWKNSDLARKMNVSGTAVGKWVRTGIIGKVNLMALSQVFGMPVTYFMNPNIPVEDDVASPTVAVHGASVGLEAIQVKDYRLAFGSPAKPSSAPGPIISMMVRRSWVEAHVSDTCAQAHLFLFTVQTDTMVPTLQRGDVLFVDTSQQCVTENGLYLVSIRGVEDVRRLQIVPDGSIIVGCDNSVYSNFTTEDPSTSSADFEVLGRIVVPMSLRPM